MTKKKRDIQWNFEFRGLGESWESRFAMCGCADVGKMVR